MPCDPYFCAKPGELTTRLAYINFKGNDALMNAPMGGFPTRAEGERFLRHYCHPLVEGVAETKSWVLKHKQ